MESPSGAMVRPSRCLFGCPAAGCAALRLGFDHAGTRVRCRGFATHLAVHAPINKALELSRTHRVLELADRLGLDLTHALAGDLEDPADLLERVGVPVADAVAELDDLALTIRQGAEHLLDALLEHVLCRGIACLLYTS